MNILIADDDERILRLLKDFLTHEGYNITTVTDGEMAIYSFKEHNYDLVILDVMMPIYDGWIVCKEIRKTSEVPIIMLTAKDSDLDQLFGFEIGVDDYIPKPFNIALVIARVKRLLKTKAVLSEKTLLTYNNIIINTDEHVVLINEENVALNPKEYELLNYFINNINRVISRDTLLRVIWDDEYLCDTRTVDTHINRLRNKLGDSAKYIKTVRGFGYKMGD